MPDHDQSGWWIGGEILPHLKQLRLVLKFPPGTAAPRMRIEAGCVCMDAPEGLAVRIPLPAPVRPESPRAVRSDGALQLIFTFSDCATTEASKTVRDDSFLPWRSVSALACGQCRLVVAGNDSGQDARFTRYVALPSQHWHEMLECWACHHEDYSSTLPGQRAGLIFAQKQSLLVGDASLVVHPSDAHLDRIQVTYTGNESTFHSNRWVQIRCRSCAYPVGECFMERDTPENTTDPAHINIVKFFKYRVHGLHLENLDTYLAMQMQPQLRKQPLVTSFLNCFVRELLEAAKAHATYRFQVHDQDQPKGSPAAMQLWLFSPEIRVVELQDAEMPTWVPAVKVLYRRTDSCSPTSLPERYDPMRTEAIYVAGDLLARLIKTLEANKMQFVAPNERKMHGYDVSVIKRA